MPGNWEEHGIAYGGRNMVTGGVTNETVITICGKHTMKRMKQRKNTLFGMGEYLP